MVMKWSAVCLVALALLGSLCEAQYPYKQVQTPKRPPPQQEKQTFETPITWTYPVGPKPVETPEGPFELRHPVPAATVAVECRERDAHVEVKKDMFGIGHFIDAADITLGNCAVSAEDNVAQVLIFEAALHDCGSSLTMTEDSLVYTYTLNYNPKALGTSGVVRTSQAAVVVECHYPRKHNVSSLPIEPIWVPYSSVKMAEEFLYFSMTLMTDDWMYARPSYQYYLGNIINVEVSVNQYHHVPLRVFVDHCVATISADRSSNPKYAFIDTGCMLDGRLTGSASQFIGRISDDKLQFQLAAFRFEGADSGLLYITCDLRAVAAASGVDASTRACSYNAGWKEASGFNSACGSCEPVGVPLPSNPGAGGGNTGYVGSRNTGYGGTGSATYGGTGNSGTGTTWGGSSNPSIKKGRTSREAAKGEAFEWQGEIRLGPIEIQPRETA